jgi:hypothetical protein
MDYDDPYSKVEISITGCTTCNLWYIVFLHKFGGTCKSCGIGGG